MKNSGKCPKCGGDQISHIEGARAPLLKVKTGVNGAATVSLYLCLGCGYCEPWVDSKIDLADLGRMFPPKKP